MFLIGNGAGVSYPLRADNIVQGVFMKTRPVLILALGLAVTAGVFADIMTEISKRDRNNPIRLIEYSACVLYAKDGYLYTEYWEDGFGVPSIVAYQIQQDIIKLIVRVKTWDFAFRIYDRFYEREGIDQFIVDVHDYYLVELVYVNDKLETYCNRIKNINTNGFVYNEAEIGSNINKVPQGEYYIYYPRYDIRLTEGMETKIISLINERTVSLVENSYTVDTYDYYYHVLIEDKQIRINGYLLDFSNKVDYRSQIGKAEVKKSVIWRT
jgi:hypothetical protein